MSFTATQNKGFRMKFDNGYSISVQWGTINYCEKKNLMAEYKDEMKEPTWKSRTAEIAVFKDTGIVPVGKSDDVIGWCSADEVATIISIVQSAHPDNQEEMVEEIKALKTNI
jgi:hypothetical protein